MTEAPAALLGHCCTTPAWPSWYQHQGQEEEQAAQLSCFPSKELQQRIIILWGSVGPREEGKEKGNYAGIKGLTEIWTESFTGEPLLPLSGHISWVYTENTVTSPKRFNINTTTI